MPVTIHQAIEIKGSAEQIWRYVGTEAGLRRWWGVDIRMDEKQGGRCEERSFLQGRAQHLRGEVTVYDPPHRLVLILRAPENTPTWPDFSTISLTLSEAEGHTRVALDHQAFGAWPVEELFPAAVGKEQPHDLVRPAILNHLPLPSVTLKNTGPQFEPSGPRPASFVPHRDAAWRGATRNALGGQLGGLKSSE